MKRRLCYGVWPREAAVALRVTLARLAVNLTPAARPP